MAESSCELVVKVIPKASKSELVGWENEALKIRLKAVPEKGAANEELIRFIAKTLDLAKSQVKLVAGEKSRQKRLKISGLTLKELYQKLSEGI